MNCPKCDSVIPDDSLFCIECGAAIRQAATGATQRIQATGNGPRCSACQTINPEGADFCVRCGRALHSSTATATVDTAGPTPSLAIETPHVNEPLATVPVPSAPPASMSRKERRHGRRKLKQKTDDIAGGIFLVGLGILFVTHWFWPGILVLLGLVGLIKSLGQGRVIEGLQALFWMAGMGILFASGWFWPGILVLVGISALLGVLGRSL